MVGLASASALTPLRITAQNGVYSGAPDRSNETQIINYVAAIFAGTFALPISTQMVSETFTINGLYLQVLVHGITYNKAY